MLRNVYEILGINVNTAVISAGHCWNIGNSPLKSCEITSIVFTFIFSLQWVGVFGRNILKTKIPVYTAQKSVWKCLKILEFTMID